MWLLVLALVGCKGDKEQDEAKLGPPPLDEAVFAQLDLRAVQEHTRVLADDGLGGRIPGSPGSEDARDYILAEMEDVGLEPMGAGDSYVWTYPNGPISSRYMVDKGGQIVPQATDTGYDLIGYVPGSDPSNDEYMVVMAHYDHLGVDQNGRVFNGAFDNAAAVAMNLEMARVFINNPDARPARNILFIFTDDEESGLSGAREWIQDPTVDPDKVICGISTDPLGRRLFPDFGPIVLIGLERSPSLKTLFQQAAEWSKTPVHFINRNTVIGFASDQDPFYAVDDPVAAVWFTNIGFADYHTTDDTADTIDYGMIRDDAWFLMQALTVIGNDTGRYPYEGVVDPAAGDAAEAKALILDVMGSVYPSPSEKELLQTYVDELDLAIAADNPEAMNLDPEILYTAVLGNMLFVLAPKYPGEIPPAWPADHQP